MFDILNHNQSAWDKQALEQHEWSQPVSKELIVKAKKGEWNIHLTPSPLDKSWLGDIKGKQILCLASAGGQQGPILAAVGALVTIFDLSEEQLNQDRKVADRDSLNLKTVQGDMMDLSQFEDDSFDVIFHPISNHYVPDVKSVWKECYRVLKKGGTLLSSFYNPVLFIANRNPSDIQNGITRPLYAIPYADINDLPKEEVDKKVSAGEALVFGHSLSDLIGGQLQAGFLISDFIEDKQPNPRFLIDNYLPTFLATRAIKS